MSVKTIVVESLLYRAGAVLISLILLTVLIYFASSFFGNSISTQAQNVEVAELAAAMAPGDSQTHYALGVLRERSFMPEDLPESLKEFERAVALSPSDFRLWLALGKARERSGDSNGAELALKEAKRLAPNYSDVQWAYGNVLLRQGKTDAAFIEIRKAVDSDPKYASPAATTMWRIYDGDVEKIRKTIGDSHYVNSALAVFLIRQGNSDEALEIWNGLPKDKLRTDFLKDSEQLYAQLVTGKKFLNAIKVHSKISAPGSKTFKVAEIDNGGFEAPVTTRKPSVFEWNIANGVRPQINISGAQKKSGRQSLVISFKTTKRSDFRAITQTIAVEGGKDYVFSVAYKSELDTSATMKWDIVDTASNKVLSSTDSLSENSDWNTLTADFSVPEGTEGVQIRLVRSGCKSAVCPISGKVWFDDFAIE
ncbi:MAG: tetratricopeptide repeat protein [Pyrinomonadaceae bacterium]|nr:tetratricopeptide repeat protein [Pyrinomonadaceae bacterium]